MQTVISSAIVVFALVAIAVCDLTPAEEDKVFNDYLQKFNIRISRSESIERIQRTFIEKYNLVESHNEKFRDGKVPYELAIDEYSILTHEEFIQQRTGYIPMPANSTLGIPPPETMRRFGRNTIPNAYSWLNTNGVVRSVQNQGSCGSCWAFAGIGALEGQMSLQKGLHTKLSEQEIIECARNPYNGQLQGCAGGYGFTVYTHANVNNGVTSSGFRPYSANTNSGCFTGTPRAAGSRTQTFHYRAPTEQAIKEYLYYYGPIYTTFHVSSDFSNYHRGVYTDSRNFCRPGTVNNHAVLIVGYGTDNGIDFWLVKNSWGGTWGESGFFRVLRGRNLCGIAGDPSFPALI